MINVVSVHVPPYTGTGKQSIASVDEIYNEIRLAIMDAARRLQTYLSASTGGLRRSRGRRPSRSTSPEIAKALSVLTGEPEEKIKEYFIRFIESRFASPEVEEVAAEEVAEYA